jgi:hypothetical protein
MSAVGNNSNLLLDPKLDSSYLVSVILADLPEVQDLLAQTIVLDIPAMARQDSTVGLARTSTLGGLLQSNSNAIERTHQHSERASLISTKLDSPLRHSPETDTFNGVGRI